MNEPPVSQPPKSPERADRELTAQPAQVMNRRRCRGVRAGRRGSGSASAVGPASEWAGSFGERMGAILEAWTRQPIEPGTT